MASVDLQAIRAQQAQVRQTPIPTDFDLSPEALRSLQAPKDILADKQAVLSFLQNRHVELESIVNPPPIYSFSGEVPAPAEDNFGTVSLISREERFALEEYAGGWGEAPAAGKPAFGMASIDDEIDSFLNGLKKKTGGGTGAGTGAGVPNVLTIMTEAELRQRLDENERKWQETIKNITDFDTLVIALAMKENEKVGLMYGRTLGLFGQLQEDKEKQMAAVDLGKLDLNEIKDLKKFETAQSGMAQSTQQLMTMIQSIQGYDSQFKTMARSLIDSKDQADKQIYANIGRAGS